MTSVWEKVRLMFDRDRDTEREVCFAHNLAFQQFVLKVGSQKKGKQGELSRRRSSAVSGELRLVIDSRRLAPA